MPAAKFKNKEPTAMPWAKLSIIGDKRKSNAHCYSLDNPT